MNKYTRLKKIGEGSFGTALLVRAKDSGKQMVVKEINMSKMGQKERVEARKETAVLAQLDHPNIVTYRESFEEIGNLYIVMDYCDGGDLYSRINQCRGILMQEDMILDWFVQICLSIKHIHDRKILHRDIKSQNVFLTKHGIIKLGDFGIAKVLNSTVELARTCIGTPYYLSPEIVENKPYNNKSDIWSLGCVLYEMTTLKHAFEAGNMKNLVLKIIRGSYPPVPPKYSYEIRNLIALLFKRSARDRPSINAVLRKPLLQNRIRKFLTENEYCDEFSHTIMHGQKIQKALPVGQKRAAAVRPTPIAAKKPPSTPKYNPASVYAPSVARKSREPAPKVRKSSEARRSSDVGVARKSAEAKRPNSGVNNAQNELAKRKQELIQKEKARQAAVKEREQQYAKQHKDLQDKQKMARMQKAREEGWKALLGSDESSSSNRKATSPKREEVRRNSPSPIPHFKPSVQDPAPRGRVGQYDHYHAYLDKLDQDRKAAAFKPTPLEPPGAHGMGAVGGVAGALGAGRVAYGEGEAVRAAEHGQAAGARGAEAANRAKILEEYLARKREAALNKARGVFDIHGAPRPPSAQQAANGPGAAAGAAPAGRPVSAREAHRNFQEDEYMSRLKQIRLNNFNERRMQHAKDKAAPAHKPPVVPESRNDLEVRRKKIEALRAQADERARRLKGELERKRREAYELEQQRLQAQKAKAVPAMPMTDAMKAIGAIPQVMPPVTPSAEKPPIGMTAALDAIGAGQVSDQDKSPLQKKKEEILKRLNSKSKAPKVSKWGKPVEPISERPKWCEAGDSGDLSCIQLEETASQMESTNANDGVTRFGDRSPQPAEEDPPVSARRQWGGRAGTVLNVMQGAELTDISDGQGLPVGDGSGPTSPRPVIVVSGGLDPTTPLSALDVSGGSDPVSPRPATAEPVSSASRINKRTQILARASLPVLPQDVGPSVDNAPAPLPEPQNENTGKLFDKVEFDDEDEDGQREQDDVVLEDLDDDVPCIVVKAGLQTGQFDIGNVQMLRTCSEPDLSKLFRTNMADNPFFKEPVDLGHASLEMPSMADEDDEQVAEEDQQEEVQQEEGKGEETDEAQDNEAEGQSEGREGDDEDDGSAIEDDDDLATVRESMMSFLEAANDDEEAENAITSTSQKKKTKKTKKTKSKFKKKKGRSVRDVESNAEGDTATSTNLPRSASAEDFATMRETMRDVLVSITVNTSQKTPKAAVGAGDGQTASKEETDTTTSGIGSIQESWASDEDEDFFEDEDSDRFSRLEEKRARLEQDLGCDTFLKAYKTVQAIHEDEDEDMEEGIYLVSRILGDEQAHLYPAILQLVMADGAFMEDNS